MTAATSTIQIQVDAKPALRSLADIKKAVQDNTSVLDRFRQASAGGFDRLEAAMNKAVGAVDRMHSTMAAMASGMGAGTAAALKQAQAMDRLAQAAKASEAAQAKANQARSSELANLRALESAKTRAYSMEQRLNRQLTDEAGFTAQRVALQDKLTTSIQRYNTVVKASGANSVAGVKARGELQRDFAGVSSEVARLAGLLPRLKGIEDKIPAKGWLSSMNRADRMMLTTMVPNMAQQIAAGGGQNIGQSVMTQAPELLQIWGAIPAQGKAVIGTLGAVAAAFGVVTAAMMRLASEGQNLRDLGVIVRATGQQGTLAAKDLMQLSDRINALPGVSREAAEKTVQSLARIRGLGAAGIQGAAYLGADYARAIGESDVAKATAKLGEAFTNPAKGARELNDALGFLSAGQLISIERMAEQGKKAEALQAVLSKLRPHLDGLAREGMSPLAVAIDRLGNSFDHLMDVIANSSMIVGLMERMANAAQNVSNAMDGPGWKWVLGSAAMANPATMPLALRSLTQAPDPKLSLPMPPPLAQTAQAAGGGAGGVLAKAAGTSDAEKELSDVLALTDGYRSFRGEREKLLDVLERTRRAQAMTNDKDVLARLRQAEEGIRDQLRTAIDPRAKMLTDAQRSAAGAWEVARAPYDQREQVTTRLQAETQAREAGMSVMQREALVRERLSELSAKGVQAVQDQVREQGYQIDSARALAAVDGMGIIAQQAATDAVTKQAFARTALIKSTDQNRDAILKEVRTYNDLVDAMGKANIETQFRQRARSASPTIQYQESMRDASGTAKYIESMGGTGDEIKRYYEDIELSKLNASQNWLDGVKRANIQYQRSAMDAATGAANAFTTSFDALNETLTYFVTTGKMKVGDFVNTVSRQFASMAIKQTITAPLANWFSGIFTKNALGGVYSSPSLSAYSNSIVSSPTLFAFAKGGALGVMGEAGDEAIMPLKRAADGSLGVRADMTPLARGPEASAAAVDASQSINVTTNNNITVNGSASGNKEADAEFAAEIARQASKYFEASVKAIVADQFNRATKPGGQLNRLR